MPAGPKYLPRCVDELLNRADALSKSQSLHLFREDNGNIRGALRGLYDQRTEKDGSG